VKDLREHLGKDERVVTSEIRDKDAIMESIKAFLGRGAAGAHGTLRTGPGAPDYLREWQEKIEGYARAAGSISSRRCSRCSPSTR
jgi:hypothetical protein